MNSVKVLVLQRVEPFLGNGSVNTFPQEQYAFYSILAEEFQGGQLDQ
jgi:hypothetical protein